MQDNLTIEERLKLKENLRDIEDYLVKVNKEIKDNLDVCISYIDDNERRYLSLAITNNYCVVLTGGACFKLTTDREENSKYNLINDHLALIILREWDLIKHAVEHRKSQRELTHQLVMDFKL